MIGRCAVPSATRRALARISVSEASARKSTRAQGSMVSVAPSERRVSPWTMWGLSEAVQVSLRSMLEGCTVGEASETTGHPEGAGDSPGTGPQAAAKEARPRMERRAGVRMARGSLPAPRDNPCRRGASLLVVPSPLSNRCAARSALREREFPLDSRSARWAAAARFELILRNGGV